MKRFIKNLVRDVAGYEIIGASALKTVAGRRMVMLDAHRISMVLDVGANQGQYAQALRRLGYRGRIASFEPVDSAFANLSERAKADAAWSVANIALGDFDGTAEIHVAGNSLSSSLLDMLELHQQAAPESRYTGKQRVTVNRLDSIFASIAGSDDKVLLKIDTQGFERKVIAGAEGCLQRILALQIEMSLVPLYHTEMLFPEMYALLRSKGYELIGIEPGFVDPRDGRLLQLDGLFHRQEGI